MAMNQAGILQAGITASSDTVTRSVLGAVESDNRPWSAVVGTWAANGTKLTTTTARTSDPRVIVMEPYTNFDITADTGYGDAMYFRYQDENNWLRVTQHQATSSSNYACNGYACNPYQYGCVDCNGYACNEYLAGYYDCNAYACNEYFNGTYSNCNAYTCVTGYYTYSCNCGTKYATRTQYISQRPCYWNVYSGFVGNTGCYGCNACCSAASCSSGQTGGSTYYCGSSGTCTQSTGYACDTCTGTNYGTCYQQCANYSWQTCYQQCAYYAWQTCYQQCCQTGYETCYETCTNYYYPVYLRLEKKVAGTLSLIREVSLGENARMNWWRVTGSGSSISIYSDRAPTTPHSTDTVNDVLLGTGYGVGRHGYGNQDSGAVLDNITIKPFGQV